MAKLKTIVDETKCLACGGCISVCPQDALSMCAGKAYVTSNKCISCAICIKVCPIGAINEEGQ